MSRRRQETAVDDRLDGVEESWQAVRRLALWPECFDPALPASDPLAVFAGRWRRLVRASADSPLGGRLGGPPAPALKAALLRKADYWLAELGLGELFEIFTTGAAGSEQRSK